MTYGKILVIDDEETISNLLNDYLSEIGYSITVARNGDEAIREINKGGFDIIITDIKMPDINGIELLKAARTIDPNAVIIVITGYATIETTQEAIRLGAYDYIIKPFQMEEIKFVVKKGIETKRLILSQQSLTQQLKELNIQLEQKVKEKTERLSLLYTVGKEISSRLDIDEVLRILVNRTVQILDSETISLLLLEDNTNELVIKCAIGLDDDIIKETRIGLGEKISGWVAQNRKPILVKDIAKSPLFSRKSDEKYYTSSLISAPLIFEDKLLGVINVNNKRSKECYTEDDLKLLEGIANQASIAINNAQLYKNLQKSYLNAITAMANALDARDPYSYNHSKRVSEYVQRIAEEMKLPPREIEEITTAALLHDIGKIGISDAVLLKTGKLTEEEWKIIKTHPRIGKEVLKPLGFLDNILPIVEHEHERYDGKGYPDGLKGDEIPLGARIIAVADSYDAMTTDRVYRKALAEEDVLKELKRCSGTQFDPQVVDAFLRTVPTFS